jgi:hypothetical protein
MTERGLGRRSGRDMPILEVAIRDGVMHNDSRKVQHDGEIFAFELG